MKKVVLFSFLSIFAINVNDAFAVDIAEQDMDIHDKADSLESFNRAMFKFNYNLDKYVLKPTAKGYRYVTTEDIRVRVRNAVSNLKEPISFANHLLQLEMQDAAISVGRFAVNSTLGLLGTFDVASGWGWTNEYTNFDRTLAHWCVPDGPYLVVPFLGPSTPRHLAGKAADTFADPIYWATADHEDGSLAYLGYAAAQAVVLREATIELTDDFERNSVDLYTTMRSAYMQNRSKYKSVCGTNTSETYDFDFGEQE